MEPGIVEFIRDYAGIVVGVVLLLVAVSVLPGRVKWYVLTAGLAVLGYEAYMRYHNRKLLQEADAERERLRGELGELDGERNALEKTVAELHQQLGEMTSRHVDLDRQREALEQEGGDITERKQALDEESAQLVTGNRELLEKVSNGESILARLVKAKQAIQHVDKVVE